MKEAVQPTTVVIRRPANDVALSERHFRLTFRRLLGLVAGLAVHVLFAITVWRLFWFLEGMGTIRDNWLWIDAGLALQFSVVHSVLLHPTTRSRLRKWIAREFYGLFFCLSTCLGLLVTISSWRASPIVVWEFGPTGRIVMWTGFGASWVALFYSLHLSGLGWQTGFTPWWHWLRGRPFPPREFRERSLFRWFRHPVYLSFLGLIWFVPVMTVDHAILTGVWTTYIFIGSWLKDRRLEHYLGASYLEYETRVPGYPFMKFGPLGTRAMPAAETQEDGAPIPLPSESMRKAA